MADQAVAAGIGILHRSGVDHAEIITALITGAASLARLQPDREEWAVAFEKAAELARGNTPDGD